MITAITVRNHPDRAEKEKDGTWTLHRFFTDAEGVTWDPDFRDVTFTDAVHALSSIYGLSQLEYVYSAIPRANRK